MDQYIAWENTQKSPEPDTPDAGQILVAAPAID
jgi:hypothetical protein